MTYTMSSPTPDYAAIIEAAYRKGRDDAATAVLGLMCHDNCDVRRCEILTEAFRAASGSPELSPGWAAGGGEQG